MCISLPLNNTDNIYFGNRILSYINRLKESLKDIILIIIVMQNILFLKVRGSWQTSEESSL